MKIRLLAILCFLSFAVFAQREVIRPSEFTGIYVGGSLQYGFLWTHRYNMGHLVKKHITAFELDFSKINAKERAFHQPFHYPKIGVALHFIPLGNPEELGTAIGLYPFINFPLGSKSRNFKMHLRFGYGMGYITHPFDPLENHKNVAIGSHVNACMSLRLNGIWQWNESNYMEIGFGLTHFSNGASTLPNLGINLPMLNIGYYHSIFKAYSNMQGEKTEDKELIHLQEILADRKWHFNAILATGFNDVDPPGGKRYGVLNILTAYMRQTGRKHKWGGGVDLMYSAAVRHKLAVDTVYVSAIGNLQPGVKVAYEFVVGRISFPIEFGVYAYSKYVNFVPVYNRFAVHYLVNDHLLLNISLKTHLARAEYFEYGLGWRF
ncbi:MAG: acyloxyacyl hydrolase [Bacteroidia bacterium]